LGQVAAQIPFGVRVAATPLSLPRTKVQKDALVTCDRGSESGVAATRTPKKPEQHANALFPNSVLADTASAQLELG
jgi:hypothetical protein